MFIALCSFATFQHFHMQDQFGVLYKTPFSVKELLMEQINH